MAQMIYRQKIFFVYKFRDDLRAGDHVKLRGAAARPWPLYMLLRLCCAKTGEGFIS
ncbi:hypothetical protein [Salipiger aestuarii]|uniref:hypothetical protein n=1 Tax=Salipiger aestuarii TaxID=568098 RepID=UPI00025B7837|nr:hypothetical protein [Salipiger aestuarii]EIE53031.1 hypothetical protein C357_00214 [Citreicella sp. 357]